MNWNNTTNRLHAVLPSSINLQSFCSINFVWYLRFSFLKMKGSVSSLALVSRYWNTHQNPELCFCLCFQDPSHLPSHKPDYFNKHPQILLLLRSRCIYPFICVCFWQMDLVIHVSDWSFPLCKFSTIYVYFWIVVSVSPNIQAEGPPLSSVRSCCAIFITLHT